MLTATKHKTEDALRKRCAELEADFEQLLAKTKRKKKNTLKLRAISTRAQLWAHLGRRSLLREAEAEVRRSLEKALRKAFRVRRAWGSRKEPSCFCLLNKQHPDHDSAMRKWHWVRAEVLEKEWKPAVEAYGDKDEEEEERTAALEAYGDDTLFTLPMTHGCLCHLTEPSYSPTSPSSSYRRLMSGSSSSDDEAE